MGPVAAQVAITKPATANAHVEPSQAEVAAANRPKWSWTVGAFGCGSSPGALGDSLLMSAVSVGSNDL